MATFTISGTSLAGLVAQVTSTGPDNTTVELSYDQHNAGTGNPYGQFTVDVVHPAGWTLATTGSDVDGCPQNVPAHIDLQSCQSTSATNIRLSLADLEQDSTFPSVADLGSLTFSGTGSDIDTSQFAVSVVDARDNAGNRDDASFQTQLVGCNLSDTGFINIADAILNADDVIMACFEVVIGPNVEIVNGAGIGLVAGTAIRIRSNFRIEQGAIFAAQVNP